MAPEERTSPPRQRRIRPRRQQAAKQVLTWLDAGRFAPGSLLPSERDLAGKLGLARGTIRQALADLEAAGRISRSHGRGWAVNAASAIQSRTLVLVSSLDIPAAGTGLITGWESSVQVGFLRAAGAAALDALLVSPARLQEGGLPVLTAPQPLGVVFMPCDVPTAELAAGLRAPGVACVAYGYGPQTAADQVMGDQAGGSAALVNWLLARGCRRILRFWWSVPMDNPPWLQQRNEGYERALRNAGQEVLPALIPGDMPARTSFLDSVERAAEILAPRILGANAVDAIMVASDGIVPTVTLACRRLGRPVGPDFPVVGFDNYWMDLDPRWYAGEVPLPSATIDKQNLAIGAELLQVIRDRVAGRLPAAPVCRVVPPRLVVPPER